MNDNCVSLSLADVNNRISYAILFVNFEAFSHLIGASNKGVCSMFMCVCVCVLSLVDLGIGQREAIKMTSQICISAE